MVHGRLRHRNIVTGSPYARAVRRPASKSFCRRFLLFAGHGTVVDEQLAKPTASQGNSMFIFFERPESIAMFGEPS